VTSTPVTLLSFRSGQASDRPFPSSITQGQFALGFGAADPGLYFLDSANSVRKVGGSQYSATAPNSSPQGQTGNSVGELWTDTTASNYLRVWNGSAWVKIGAGFADNAQNASQCLGKIATTFTGALPPVGIAGAAAFNTATGAFYVSNGSAWVLI
jgi:hypothetical protein